MKRFIAVAVTVMLLGCGGMPGLVNDGYQSGLTSVRGNLTSTGSTPAASGKYGVTVVWLPYWLTAEQRGNERPDILSATPGFGPMPTSPLGTRTTLCDPPTAPFAQTDLHKNLIAVSPAVMFGSTLPTSFVLPLTQPPPADAMLRLSTLGGRGTTAIGTLVAFDDLNGNGQLDLGSSGKAAEPIVAASIDPETQTDSRAVLYLDGILPRDVPWPEQAQQGFNVVVQGHTRIATEPPTTPVDLNTAFAVSFNQAVDLCATRETRFEYNSTLPAGAYPTCTASGPSPQANQFYWYLQTAPSACLSVTSQGYRCFEPGEALPAGWVGCAQ